MDSWRPVSTSNSGDLALFEVCRTWKYCAYYRLGWHKVVGRVSITFRAKVNWPTKWEDIISTWQGTRGRAGLRLITSGSRPPRFSCLPVSSLGGLILGLTAGTLHQPYKYLMGIFFCFQWKSRKVNHGTAWWGHPQLNAVEIKTWRQGLLWIIHPWDSAAIMEFSLEK